MHNLLSILAQFQDNDVPTRGGGLLGVGLGCCFLVFELALLAIVIVGMWKVFTKARQPGWAALIPIFNIYILTQIAGKPAWWVILFFIPLVNIVIAIILTIDVAKYFGKGIGFAIGMILLPFIFYPILGFGPATYNGPAKPFSV